MLQSDCLAGCMTGCVAGCRAYMEFMGFAARRKLQDAEFTRQKPCGTGRHDCKVPRHPFCAAKCATEGKSVEAHKNLVAQAVMIAKCPDTHFVLRNVPQKGRVWNRGAHSCKGAEGGSSSCVRP